MIKHIKYILLLATFAIAEKQIKLEDIERDNLLSERRVNRDEETVKSGESPQHLLAPIFVGPSNEVRNGLKFNAIYTNSMDVKFIWNKT